MYEIHNFPIFLGGRVQAQETPPLQVGWEFGQRGLRKWQLHEWQGQWGSWSWHLWEWQRLCWVWLLSELPALEWWLRCCWWGPYARHQHQGVGIFLIELRVRLWLQGRSRMSCCFLLVCSSILIMTPKRSKSYIVLILILRVRTITRVPLRARRKRTRIRRKRVWMFLLIGNVLFSCWNSELHHSVSFKNDKWIYRNGNNEEINIVDEAWLSLSLYRA